MHAGTNSYKLKGHGKLRGWCGQKWMWPVMWWDSKIDSIWRMNKWNKLIFGMLMQIHNSWKLMKNLFGGHGQKWVWPVWILDSKIYNLIFCMLVQVEEGWKLIQSFLSVLCQRWQWLFSSWDPKTCILKMNLWI